MSILIKGGFVADPANEVASRLNLVLEAGKVADVTSETPDCEVSLNAEGRCVVPGFIDIHMHEEGFEEDGRTLKKTLGRAMAQMGVTTAIGGNCGENAMDPLIYLDQVEKQGSPIHMGLLAGHRFFREMAGCRDKYSRASEAELEVMKAMIEKRLDAGCGGVSFGIRYVPGIDERELLEIGALCQKDRKLLSAHVRDDAAFVFDAVKELTGLGEALQVPVQVSHIGSMGGFGQMEEVLQMIDQRRAGGQDVTADCYPYYAFSTGIGETTYDDGFLERYHMDYSGIEICEGRYKGRRCDEAIFRELRQNAPETLTICHVMKPEDVDLAVLHPGLMIASDGLMDDGQGHPRAAGTFPRVFARYVRTGKLSLYDAVAKMTALPARKLGLKDKGQLGKGADADLVIFDPARIEDRATFDAPLERPEGIDYVLIDGQTAVDHGEIINDSLGRAVRFLP